MRAFVIALAMLLLSACGGGGGGSSSQQVPVAQGGTSGGSGGSGSGSSGGSSSAGPEWVEGEFGDWTQDYIAQCENPRTSSEYDDTQGSTALEKFWIRDYSFDTYLWYDEITDLDPNSDEETLDVELRGKGVSESRLEDWIETRKYFELMKTFELTAAGNPRDRFHFTYDTEEWEQLTQSGISAGYGMEFYRVRSSPPRQWLIAYTEPNTPASDGGVVRGLEVSAIDGVDFRDGSDVATLNAGLFPAELGEVHTFTFRDPATDETFSVDLESQEIASTPVQSANVFERDGANIGYVLFNDHIRTAESLLIDEMTAFRDANISELVLDLRYNGGGFLDIARMVASMIAGEEAVGQTFSELQFNDKYTTRNPITGRALSPSLFANTAPGFEVSSNTPLPMLNLDRVVVISGSGTCSASEAIINGLRGVGVDVVLIGDTTCGKPYGFYGIDNCSTTYFTVQFKGVNALGFGDYTDGFSPSGAAFQGEEIEGCAVEDDLTRQLGDPLEGRLAAALAYLDTGSCPEASGVSEKSGSPSMMTPKGIVIKRMPEGLIARE
ncbi:MAG: S41 family peptidase [Gammaproteobacteria bacterium]